MEKGRGFSIPSQVAPPLGVQMLLNSALCRLHWQQDSQSESKVNRSPIYSGVILMKTNVCVCVTLNLDVAEEDGESLHHVLILLHLLITVVASFISTVLDESARGESTTY